MDIEALQTQYNDCLGRASRLKAEMESQLAVLLNDGKVTLGVPMESRIKTWDSIIEKFERKQLEHEKIEHLQDLIGLRLILLFRSDLELVERLIKTTFDVISSEDTAQRLGEAQFGYQSQHYIVRLPQNWLTVPTMAGLNGFTIEIQVRTLAQHVWASASHKLQYKHEQDVPPPMRRTIHRVSALLETVDLELDRVLQERANYLKKGIPAAKNSESLNVDLLASVLNEVFPAKNRTDTENYGVLLRELNNNSINTVEKIKSLLKKHYNSIMEYEQNMFESITPDIVLPDDILDQHKKGVHFSHVGLVRKGLQLEFGDKYSGTSGRIRP